MKRPEDVRLSREEGEALIERIERNVLSAEDRRLLVKILTFYVAERALKLAIRQRKNSLFYATEHSATIASILTSVIATCIQAGVNALDYLVALQEHRQEVFVTLRAWLPWNYTATLGTS